MGFIDDTLGTNIFGKNATDRAIDAQRGATDKSLALQEEMYNTQREDMAPWLEAGREQLANLTGQMPELTRSFSMDDFQKDPGYQFRMEEGQKALERSAAARGGLGSGRMMKDLSRFGQGLASQEYQNAYSRFNQDQANRYNRIANLAGVGQAAAGQMGQYAGAYGTNASNLLTNMGNAQAGAELAQANRFANLLGQGAQVAGAAMGAPTTSDRRMKTDIEEIKESELKEFRDSIKPYIFRYKNKEDGEGLFGGIMAQDLEKSKLGKLAVIEIDGVKKVNFNKLIPLVVASLGQGA
jgi:hypothetical protein